MKKNSTILLVCGLLLIADYLSIKQTIGVRENLSATFVTLALIAQACSAAMLALIGFLVYRKKHARQKKPVSRSGFAPLEPLRRLFVSVWQ